jgi:hypothetical protein
MEYGHEIWNVDHMSLYRVGSLMTVSRKLSRYWLDLVGVQEVRSEGSGTKPAGESIFFYGKGKENHELGTVFYIIESYQQLKGVLDIHATAEDKPNDVKDSFYEELEHTFDKFLKYHMKILLGYFKAKLAMAS